MSSLVMSFTSKKAQLFSSAHTFAFVFGANCFRFCFFLTILHQLQHAELLLCCSQIVMASSIAVAQLNEGTARLNRPFLMRALGLRWDFPFLGDVSSAPIVKVASAPSTRIHTDFVPFLNFGACYERCSGAKLLRHERNTISMPCFETTLVSGGSVCAHCNELWAMTNDDGFFQLVPDEMPNAAACYEDGPAKAVHNLPET